MSWQPNSSASSELLTVKQSAAWNRVSESTIRRQIRSGELPACKVGAHSIRIRRADLDAIATPLRADHSAADRLEAYIAKVVAEAPPFTPEQIDRIASLLSSASGNGGTVA